MSLDFQTLDLAKEKLDALRPLSGRQVLTRGEAWDIEMVYESNRIEGNSLTLRETEMVVARGMTIAGKPLKDHLEAVNLMAAWRHLLTVTAARERVTESETLALHAMVMARIADEEAGRYRRGFVRIAGARHVPPNAVKVPALMGELFTQAAASHAVAEAARLHHGIPSIHPFSDGNGRTARLVMNFTLLRAGYPPVSLSADRREAYYAALEKADTGDESAFASFVGEAVHTEIERWLAALSEESR
ncbi:MAG: Fic family protein [Chthoniobacteraceae bacterium]